MAVNINLKEVFKEDNQQDLVNKLNFNFNQLIALGVGDKGGKGNKGDKGNPGPRGPRGFTGDHGSTIWSEDGSVFIDLTVASPPGSLVGDYYVGKVTIGTSSYNGIYKKESEGTVWTVITDFSEVFRDALNENGGELFPWRVGVNGQTPPARIIIPVNNSQGIDRITSEYLSKPADYYLTYQPNWKLDTASVQNSQGVIFNFDVSTAKKIISNSVPDNNGYLVKVTDSRLGSDVSSYNEAFPYTALLSLYSFYDKINAATKPDQFISSTGYRHQLELGSIDDIPEALHTIDSNANFVISPTYQNLRVRKYRVGADDLPGESAILADFVLSSGDTDTDPAINSKMQWSVNKKTEKNKDTNSVLSMALSSSTLESSQANIGLTGLLVDGLHLKRVDPTGAYSIAFGFDPFSTDSFVVKAESQINKVLFDALAVSVRGASTEVQLNEFGINGLGGSDVAVYASDGNKEVKIGQSDEKVAISIKGNRLNSAIPFAYSAGTYPTFNSPDPNTLDEYQEGLFTPTVYFGSLPTPGAGVLTNSSPTILEQTGAFVKIGRHISFTVKFKVRDWTVVTTSGRVSPPYFNFDPHITSVSVGNLSNTNDTWTGMQHALGDESYQIAIRSLGIFDHWPMTSISDKVEFDVSIAPAVKTGYTLRPFSMSYSWRQGTLVTASTYDWLPIAPNSIKAKFRTYEDGVNKPELAMFGHRQNLAGVVSPIESKFSIYDLLNYVHPVDPAYGNVFEVTVSGGYITDHQTANDVNPIGVTTTTTTAGSTTTTSSTTTSSTTTTTSSTTTTTTTAGPPPAYGSELLLNSHSPYGLGGYGTDWDDKFLPTGLGDHWQPSPLYQTYSILTGSPNGFVGRAQRLVRTSTRGGGIGIGSNTLEIGPNSNTYEVNLIYRSSHQVAVNQHTTGSAYVTIGVLPANPSGAAVPATLTFNSNGNPFSYLSFFISDDKNTGPTIWMEIDRVSCRRKM